MKRYYWLFVLLVSSRLLAAQPQADSLLRALSRHPANDIGRLILLNELSQAYINLADTSKALGFSTQAVTLAQKISPDTLLATAYLNEGKSYLTGFSPQTALGPLQKALNLYEQLHNEQGIINTQFFLAQANAALSNLYEAIDYFQQSLNIAASIKDTLQMAKTMNNIGSVYLNMTDYPKAVGYFQQALTLFETSKDSTNIARANGNIAIVYLKMSEYDKAIERTQQAFAIFQNAGDHIDMARCLTNMGNAYRDRKNFIKAIDCFQQAIMLDKKAGAPASVNLTNNIMNVGMTYSEMRQYSNALPYLEEALDRAEQHHMRTFISITLSYLAELYQKAPDNVLAEKGIAPSQRFNKAAGMQKRAIALAMQVGDIEHQAEEWKNLSLIYESSHHDAQALEAYKHYTAIKDSTYTIEKNNAVTRKEMQYEFDKKEAIANAEQEKQHALAQAEIHRQRTIKNTVAGGTGVLAFASIFSFFFYKKKRDAILQQKETEFKLQVADTEMKALRAQMNPHFIFNSLNSISDYMMRNDAQSADYYLTRFARLMRMILENSEQKEITLSEDLKALEAYMELEALRLNHKFIYEIQIDKDIDPDNTMVPPLILQPFVENSIWHGISQKSGKGKIIVEIKKEDEMINCIVEDNGVGRSQPAFASNLKKSLGMKITKARIEIMNKIKKSKADIGLSDLAEGTRVEVKLPLELSF